MVDSQDGRKARSGKGESFDERYLGLSRSEVLLREKMAKRYGRQAQHLDASAKPSSEESKGKPASAVDKLSSAQQEDGRSYMSNNPGQKLRQLQMDNEKYRASIASGHQLLQRSMSEQAQSQYQYKFMKGAQSEGFVSEQDSQNSRVVEPEHHSQNELEQSSSLKNESARKNLELLKTILQDFSAEELERDIFTLNEVMVLTEDPANKKAARKKNSQAASASKTRNAAQATARPQIVLNEKQFNLIKKVYPQALQSHPQSMLMGAGASNTMQFTLQDPQLIIQFFANMQALYRRMNQQ